MKTMRLWVGGLMVLGGLVSVVAAADAGSKIQPVAGQAYELRMAGKNQAARTLLGEHLAQQPDDAACQFEYSRTLFYLFDFEAARKVAQEAVRIEPDNARYRYWLGQTCVYRGVQVAKGDTLLLNYGKEVKRAIAALEKAVALRPDYHEARYLLINMYNNNDLFHGGNKKKAKEHTRLLELHDAYYGVMARHLMERPDGKAKIADLTRLLEKEPNNAGLRELLAVEYGMAGQDDRALEQADRAIQLDPEKRPVLLILARNDGQKKNNGQALALIERFLKEQPDQPAGLKAFGLGYLANVQRRLGHPEAAQQAAEQARALDPEGWSTFQPPPGEVFRPLDD